MTMLYNRLNRALGPLLGLLALGLYLATLSPGPFPGESAAQMAGQLGLEPFGTGSHLIWSLLVRLVDALPFGGFILRLNMFSALCGALAIWMVYRLAVEAIWLTVQVDTTNVKAFSQASMLAGVATSIALMGSIPFWYASNRFHVASYDLLYLLIVARVFVAFAREASPRWGLLFAFLFGLGAVQFATFIVLAPLALIGVLRVLWYEGDLRWARVLSIAGALLGGLLFYLVAAWQFMLSTEFQIGVGGHFGQAIYWLWHMQYNLIAHGLPELGWLLVILVGIVPWLAVLLVARRGLNEEKDWGLVILHVLLAAVVLAVLFNASFAPWRLLGPVRLLVTPYLLTALCFGYLTAYWFLFPRLWGHNADPDERGVIWLRERGGWVPAALLLAAAVGAGTLNARVADARGSGAIHGFARQVVRSLDGRPWLVTDGLLDHNLLLAAQELKTPLRVLNLRMGNSPVYMRYVAGMFKEPRLKSLAEVDVLAMVREWMASDAKFSREVALLLLPDMWLAGGFQPVADRTLFIGVRELSDLDIDTLWARNLAFWNEPCLKDLAQGLAPGSLSASYAAFALRHTAMVANNLGVVLEDAGWRQQAFEAYRNARQIDPGNISALLNQFTMVERGYSTPDEAKVREDFKTLTTNLKEGMQIWSLARYYGYVRDPTAYASLGMVWALSGEPGMAVAGFKRAIELATSHKDQLTQGLAMAYLAQDQLETGEKLYRELIARDPRNVTALVGLSRLAARQNRFAEAAGLLDQAQQAGASKERIAIEYAALHLAAGETGKARVVLQELVELHPDLAQAWAMLAGILIQTGETASLEECERKLERVKGKDFLTTVVLGQIALSRGDLVGARNYLETALAMRPSTPLLLELLLRLDVHEARRDAAAQHVRTLLWLDPGNAFANHVLASFQTERKEYALAENSLRKSLQRLRAPEALNDLAWVLAERGALEEAERLAREALQGNDKAFNCWDTLGVILTRQAKFDEAEAALKHALSLFAESVDAQVHLVELYEKKGDRSRMTALAEDLLARSAGLSTEQRDELRTMVRGVRPQ